MCLEQQTHVALAAFSGSTDGMWVVDSGADSHVCMDIALMHNIRSADSNLAFGNGSAVKVKALGDVILATTSSDSRQIVLHDVLYVPEATANLLSVSHATQQGARLEFTQTECKILIDSTAVLTAQRRNGLYCFKDQKSTQRQVLLTSAKEDPELWHRRFGHLGFTNLARMQQLNMVSGIKVTADDFKQATSHVCEPCIMAKQTRAPFPGELLRLQAAHCASTYHVGSEAAEVQHWQAAYINGNSGSGEGSAYQGYPDRLLCGDQGSTIGSRAWKCGLEGVVVVVVVVTWQLSRGSGVVVMFWLKW